MERKELVLSKTLVKQFEENLREEEKSKATIEKYVRDLNHFMGFAGEGKIVTKETVISYKQHVAKDHAVSSSNSMLAALNCFLRFAGFHSYTVRAFRMQKAIFRSKEQELSKEEYFRLVETARRRGDHRLCMVMQTICATGIRISELRFITVESLLARRAVVSLKGKSRVVILPVGLCRELESYVQENGIHSGSIFVTRTGRPIDRTNVLHSMKALCEEANVERGKAFPHNLRHLFAVTYYNAEKDVCHLADLLGHSNVNTTRVYTLMSCETLEKQVEELVLVLGECQ